MKIIPNKKWLHRLVAVTLALTTFSTSQIGAAENYITDTFYNISNPTIQEASASGQLVSWDSIYFGSYPQSEVTADDEVYPQLVKANGWDFNGDIVIDGEKYRRLNQSQATSNKGFPWEDDTTYHYFRYEPVKWRVLEVEDGETLLLSDVILDTQRYNKSYEFMSWDKSTLRSWLNGYGTDCNKNALDYTNNNFIDTAFSMEEQEQILVTAVRNDDNYIYDSVEDATTNDKVFLLSSSEAYGNQAATAGFTADENVRDEARRCSASTYANAMGTIDEKGGFYEDFCIWWLRTPGKERFGMYVEASGKVNTEGYVVNSKNYGVRVAIRVNFATVEYDRYGGRVYSDGRVIEGDPIGTVTLTNPTVTSLGKPMVSQQLVTWDSVYFGSYPQVEVVSGDAVYESLVTATEWQENEILLDGVKYRRMKRSDATFSQSYRNYEAFLANPVGYYWEDYDSYHYFKYEPIRWRVLQVTDSKALLLSDVVLDTQNYTVENVEATWETSAIRSWLNGCDKVVGVVTADGVNAGNHMNFMDRAFTKEEQLAIVTNASVNEDNLNHGTDGGNHTSDKVFLLAEKDTYMATANGNGFLTDGNMVDEARRCHSSTYAKAMGVYSSADKQYAGNCSWLLRTPGINQKKVAGIVFDGVVDSIGTDVYGAIANYGVRPALVLDLTATECYTVGEQIGSDVIVNVNDATGEDDTENDDAEDGGQDDKPGNTTDNESGDTQGNITKILPGDVNADGEITLEDAQLVLKAALKIEELEEAVWKAADVKEDNIIDLADAQKILKAALKIE